MTRIFTGTVLAFALAALVQAQAGVTGKWQGETKNGSQIVLDVKAAKTELTGTLTVDGEPNAISEGKLAKRLADGKGEGKFDTLDIFKDNKLIREERDADGDGYFDLRIFFDENGRELRQEADTNGDRRVDVWATYKEGKRFVQEEDRNFSGKIDARYFFKDDQVIKQEQVAEAEPDAPALPFASAQEEIASMATEAEPAGKKIATTAAKEQEAGKQ